MTLAYQWIRPNGEQKKTFMMIHGILGSKRNWISFAKRFAEKRPEWQGLVVDLRHHGESSAMNGENTVLACAKDLSDLRAITGVEPQMLSGHSFGGKVAMRYAENFADDLQTLFVLDSPPGIAEHLYKDSDISRVFEMVETAPMPVKDRRSLREYVTSKGLSVSLALWMTTNLKENPKGEGLVWRFTISKIKELLSDYAQQDCWPFLRDNQVDAEIIYVKGERSDRFSEEDVRQFKDLAVQGKLNFEILENAGHWVHSDNPEGLLDIFERFQS